MVIVIDDYGVDISRENASFLLTKGELKRQVSPHRVTAIHVRKPCNISTPAILLAAEFQLPILFFNGAGKVKARLWQTHYGSHSQIRHMQLIHANDAAGLAWVREGISLKADGQCTVLKWLNQVVPSQSSFLSQGLQAVEAGRVKLMQAMDVEAVRSSEAQIGRCYWEAYFEAMSQYESADKRSRRPAADRLNSLLNYGYGMLYGEVESATLTAGLDPHIGILHRDEYGKPAFVFDAIEPHRPWVDRLVAELAIKGRIKSGWFEAGGGGGASSELGIASGEPGVVKGLREDLVENQRTGETIEATPVRKPGYWLSREGKKAFIPAWYAMIFEATLHSGKKIKRRDQIQQRLTALAQHLLKDFNPGSHG